MTKPFLITLVLAVGQSRLLAAALNLAGEPFHPGQAEVVWSVRSNDYPPALWIYRVIPHHFAPPIVSNLMAIGNFAMKDRRRPDRQGRLKDKEALCFADNDKTRYSGIYPSQGFIDYYDSKARADMKAPIEGVPTESEALRLALNLLQQLGVDRGKLATKPGSCELRACQTEGRRGRLDKARGEIAREIDSRGVYFVRRVDGADLSGRGAASIRVPIRWLGGPSRHGRYKSGVPVELSNCGIVP